MHTKEDWLKNLQQMNINPKGTLIVHSSLKSIGAVEGGPETVLEAFSYHMKEGLLVFPTHTRGTVDAKNPHFYVAKTPSHVDVLTERFRKHPQVSRSWHPTHSVAALEAGTAAFIAGDEQFDTPATRGSVYGNCWMSCKNFIGRG